MAATSLSWAFTQNTTLATFFCTYSFGCASRYHVPDKSPTMENKALRTITELRVRIHDYPVPLQDHVLWFIRPNLCLAGLGGVFFISVALCGIVLHATHAFWPERGKQIETKSADNMKDGGLFKPIDSQPAMAMAFLMGMHAVFTAFMMSLVLGFS